jgi:hypothetical protein
MEQLDNSGLLKTVQGKTNQTLHSIEVSHTFKHKYKDEKEQLALDMIKTNNIGHVYGPTAPIYHIPYKRIVASSIQQL